MYFLAALGARSPRPKTRVPAESVLERTGGLETAAFLPCFHMASSLASFPVLIKTTSLSQEAGHLYDLTYLTKGPVPKHSHTGF